MTAETDLLPLGERDPNVADAMRTYARACVSSATEALRAEVERWKSLHATAYDAFRIGVATERRLEARAERLAEALRDVLDSGSAIYTPAFQKARAALDQETTNG